MAFEAVKAVVAVTLSLTLGPFARTVTADAQPRAQSPSSPGATASEPEFHFVSILTFRGEVTNIDPQHRLITLKDPNGKTSTFEVRGEGDFDRFKLGDRIVVRYFEGIRVRKEKAGQPRRATTVSSLKTGLIGSNIKGSGKEQRSSGLVSAIDVADQEVTIEGADGSSETMMVLNPEDLGHIKTGDHVEIVRAQALAVRLEEEGDSAR